MRRSVEEYMQTGKDHDGYIEPQVSSLDTYPSYIAKEAEDTVKQVQKLQGFHTVSFGFMTDIHYGTNLNVTYDIRIQRALNAYKEIAKRTKLEFLALGGDHANDGIKEYKKACFRELRAKLDGIRYFPVNGNHDDNAIWDVEFIPIDKSINHLTPEEVYVLFYNHIPSAGGHMNQNNGLYYYYNNPEEKVRYIFLDTNDIPLVMDDEKLRYYAIGHYDISQQQLDWLVNEALRLEEPDWTIVLFTHVPVFCSGYHQIIHNVLATYKNGAHCKIDTGEGELRKTVDVDFSQYQRADIAAVFAGHTHADGSKVIDGIPYIVTANSVMYYGGGEYVPRTDGDKTELLFDIVTINKDKRTVSLTRVGAGEDRVFSY